MSSEVIHIGFAENIQSAGDDNSYTEWLQNNTEFPCLTLNKAVEGDWDTLDKSEINNGDLLLVQEEGNWSKINDFNLHSFADVAEKNSSTLKLRKSTVRPLFSYQNKTKMKSYFENIYDDEDFLDSTFVYNTKKAQSKDALRSGHLRTIHDLRVLDSYYPSLLRIGTSQYKGKIEHPEETFGGNDHYRYWLDSKGTALKFVANFNVSKCKDQYIDKTTGHKVDYTNFSVLEPLKIRKNVSHQSSNIPL